MVAMTLPAKPWVNGMMTADGTRMFDSSVGSEGAWRATPIPAGGLPAGSIIQWSSNTAPPNWFIADGSAISRTLWPSLFAVIGTTYGSGDGSTTFNLPDLRGRVAVGKNAGTFGTIGATGGAETNTHKHWTLTGHNAGDPATYYRTGSPNGVRTQTTSRRTIAEGSYSSNATTYEDATYDATINTLPPYLVTNYIIKATTGWSAGDSELALRMAAAETAAATTNKSGLVPVVPSSLNVSSGSASASSSGLVTFTGVTSVSLNNVFSSSYRNYRMVIDIPTSTGTAIIGVRYRTGTTDNSANNYFQYQAMNRLNGSVNTNSGGPNTFYSLCTIGTQTNSFTSWSGDIMMPFISTGQTSANGLGMGSDATSSFQAISSVLFNGATSFDGITIMTNGGTTITGTVKIYGYN